MSIVDQFTPKTKSIKPAFKSLDRIIKTDAQNFREKFNRSPFIFSHNLTGHPLFEVPRLVELSNSLLSKGKKENVLCMLSDSSAQQKWGDLPQKEQVVEAIADIEESGTLIFLKGVHLDLEYKALLDKCLGEFEELTSVPLGAEITWSMATIIISSPRSFTPYHIDHESNFLFQIQGEKEVYLFDPDDRSVLTEQEIEEYYTGNFQSAIYKEENQNKANIYNLIPGKGVHQPPRSPHWVKNGNNVSISLSINFCMQSIDWQAKVYQINHYLRKLGLEPTPPGRSSLQDSLKVFALGMFSKRKPTTHDQVLCSGIQRIKALANPIELVAGRLKR